MSSQGNGVPAPSMQSKYPISFDDSPVEDHARSLNGPRRYEPARFERASVLEEVVADECIAFVVQDDLATAEVEILRFEDLDRQRDVPRVHVAVVVGEQQEIPGRRVESDVACPREAGVRFLPDEHGIPSPIRMLFHDLARLVRRAVVDQHKFRRGRKHLVLTDGIETRAELGGPVSRADDDGDIRLHVS